MNKFMTSHYGKVAKNQLSNTNGGGILLYAREYIPSNFLSYENKPFGFYVELNLRKL